MKNFSINIWLNGSANDALEMDFDDGIVKYYYPSIDGRYLFSNAFWFNSIKL